ncbi:MAG: hypothetical protein JO125_04180 [Chloroflexi bacterium]|nr:hypothetical protein [Ktedonobacteraceae bacterium]MBV9020520.1 hypothetical protein [Ktedonobacteraceae bacterium]MBV9706588.1 hypothetical protein [Chloroflexota bacterium]
MKKLLSLDEIASQAVLELPARELMTVHDFTNGAFASAANACAASATAPGATVLDIGACVGIQAAVDTTSATQTIS